jgi:hypothetical protein
MFARATTVAFEGIEARGVDVQVQIGPGMPHFTIVGLPDKAVAESRERVRGALNAIGLALPPKRITVNLAPADLPKEWSHYDLPIALGLMAATASAGTGPSARRIIRRAWRPWSAAARGLSPAKLRSRISAFCSSTSCPSFIRKCSTRCASRSKPARR